MDDETAITDACIARYHSCGANKAQIKMKPGVGFLEDAAMTGDLNLT